MYLAPQEVGEGRDSPGHAQAVPFLHLITAQMFSVHNFQCLHPNTGNKHILAYPHTNNNGIT